MRYTYIQKDVLILLWIDEVGKRFALEINSSVLLRGKFESYRETDQLFCFDDTAEVSKRYMGKEIKVIKWFRQYSIL